MLGEQIDVGLRHVPFLPYEVNAVYQHHIHLASENGLSDHFQARTVKGQPAILFGGSADNGISRTGAKNEKRVRDTCRVALQLAAGIACVGIVVFESVPEILLYFFQAGEAMMEIGIPALRIIAPTFLPAAVTMVAGYLISGFGNGTVNMIATAMRQLVLLLPVVWAMGELWGIGSVWYAFWVSELMGFLYAGWKLRYHLKKQQMAARQAS